MGSILAVPVKVPSKIRLGEVVFFSHFGQDPVFESLERGGAIFLGTPRGKTRVWLVAILESTRRRELPNLPAAWMGTANATPITDVSAIVTAPEVARELSASEEEALRAAARGRSSKAPPTSWRFQRMLDTSLPKKLGPTHREQLAVACTFYDGRDTRADALPPGIFGKRVVLWRVLDGKRHVFDFWSGWDGDWGTLFFANDAEPVGIEVIQAGWGVYPKVGWVKRGMKLPLHHLAWELGRAFVTHRGGTDSKPTPAPPRVERIRPLKWKTRGPRKGDLEGT